MKLQENWQVLINPINRKRIIISDDDVLVWPETILIINEWVETYLVVEIR